MGHFSTFLVDFFLNCQLAGNFLSSDICKKNWGVDPPLSSFVLKGKSIKGRFIMVGWLNMYMLGSENPIFKLAYEVF